MPRSMARRSAGVGSPCQRQFWEDRDDPVGRRDFKLLAARKTGAAQCGWRNDDRNSVFDGDSHFRSAHPSLNNLPIRVILRLELMPAAMEIVAACFRRQRMIQQTALRGIAGNHQMRHRLEILQRDFGSPSKSWLPGRAAERLEIAGASLMTRHAARMIRGASSKKSVQRAHGKSKNPASGPSRPPPRTPPNQAQ